MSFNMKCSHRSVLYILRESRDTFQMQIIYFTCTEDRILANSLRSLEALFIEDNKLGTLFATILGLIRFPGNQNMKLDKFTRVFTYPVGL